MTTTCLFSIYDDRIITCLLHACTLYAIHDFDMILHISNFSSYTTYPPIFFL